VTTFRLTLEYDGGDFHGWQFQPAVRTVEGALRDALHVVTGETPPITAAGRTDAGAHAHGQVVGVTLQRAWDPSRLTAALNAVLPADAAVVDAAVTDAAFHARRHAITRTYRYVVACRAHRAAVTRRHAWTVRGRLDVAAMRSAGATLVGTHDFAAFGAPTSAHGNTVRTVHELSVWRTALTEGQPRPELDVIVITVRANAFLRGMMRTIAGALVAAGQGRLGAVQLAGLLDTPRGRHSDLTVAPPHGLHQWSVTYAPSPAAHQGMAA
jgi:tRNA pseudouridine38-40 synthase